MTTAEAPRALREALRDPFTEADLARLWPSIERRRARGASLGRALWLTAATAAAVTALVIARPRPPSTPAAGPLRLASGEAIGVIEGARGDRAVTLSDRSRITLSDGARVEARRNDARAFDTALPYGRVRFDVQPRGPRAWSIDCGLATVRVVGTSFTIDRSPDHLRVEVSHGLVRVEGERVPERVKLLAAGQSIDISAERSPVAPVAQAPAPEAPVAPAPSRVARAVTPEPWRALAARRDFQRAYEALGPGGTEARASTASTDDLLALGEVAHRSRHYAEAARLYARFVSTHPEHAQAGMVAFTLGRIQIDQLGAPGDAARSFDRALQMGVARYLREDVLARLVEARARSGDAVGARASAAEYQRLYPDGRRAADVRRWVE